MDHPIIKIFKRMDQTISLREALQRFEQTKPKKKFNGGRRSQPHIRNSKGRVTHIFCSYHKLWEPVTVGFPLNTSSWLGYKPMCKEGYNAYCNARYHGKLDQSIVPRKDDIGSVEIPDYPGAEVFGLV